MLRTINRTGMMFHGQSANIKRVSLKIVVTDGVSPLPGAKIELDMIMYGELIITGGMVVSQTKFTDSNGVALFRVLPGTFNKKITLENYTTIEEVIEVTGPVTINEVMEEVVVDAIQVLVDEYKAATIAYGGRVEDETAVYNVIEADVTAGLVASDGTNTKLILRAGYKFGLVAVGGKEDELVSLYKIGGVYPKLKAEADTTRLQLEADHLNMNWNAPTLGRVDTSLELDVGKNSFFIEFKGHAYYVSGTSYFITTNPVNANVKIGTGSTQRGVVATYNIDGSNVTQFTNNNLLLDEFATYRFEFVRSGNICTPKLYRNGTLWQTMADRTWDKEYILSDVVAHRLIGSLNSTIKLQEYKIGLL